MGDKESNEGKTVIPDANEAQSVEVYMDASNLLAIDAAKNILEADDNNADESDEELIDDDIKLDDILKEGNKEHSRINHKKTLGRYELYSYFLRIKKEIIKIKALSELRKTQKDIFKKTWILLAIQSFIMLILISVVIIYAIIDISWFREFNEHVFDELLSFIKLYIAATLTEFISMFFFITKRVYKDMANDEKDEKGLNKLSDDLHGKYMQEKTEEQD